MKAVTPGEILGIPTPIQWTVGDGPIEPRIFQVNDTVYVTFNTGKFFSIECFQSECLVSDDMWDVDCRQWVRPFTLYQFSFILNLVGY